MLAWLAPIVVFGLVVFVHELGHFLAAKSVGVYCPRFSIGCPRIHNAIAVNAMTIRIHGAAALPARNGKSRSAIRCAMALEPSAPRSTAPSCNGKTAPDRSPIHRQSGSPRSARPVASIAAVCETGRIAPAPVRKWKP